MSSVPTYSLYGENDRESAEFWVHAESIPSRSSRYDWEIRPHRHEHLFQILHMRRGRCTLSLGQRTVTLEGPAVVVTPPRHDHGFRFSPDIDGSVLTFVAARFPACRPPMDAEPAAMADWLSQPRVVPLEAEQPDRDFLVLTLAQIEREILTGTASAIALVESLLASALGLMLRISGEAPEGGLDRDRARLALLERMIAEDFRAHLPVTDYARRLGVSATHLNRITTIQTGKPVSRLIAERIVTEAKRELAMTMRPIGEIADSLGFDDQAYFSRFFSSKAGLSPRAYRDRAARPAG
ncbi:helix-turn-helix domain-containing protein [Rhizobium halophytocola]|uniref:AraC family transcriptional activator of pobA n=1 Tax=Rhizobium halophytocola TaxID=735519 RepID=A0ABS4DSJ0_9HYPH|nr:helix-turn-helix domain-containing protein [Rhizobium halophytocola]MBP1848657.1 AraC family transcriptional activator of pobA [Rhizobium halophytocola]